MTLQFRQIVKQRRAPCGGSALRFFRSAREPAANTFDNRFRLVARRGQFHRRIQGFDAGPEPGSLVGCAFTRRERRHYIHVVFGNEVADREFSLHQHGERRRLYAAHRELLLVRRERIGAREVHAYQPVGTAAPARSIGEIDRTRERPAAWPIHREWRPASAKRSTGGGPACRIPAAS